MKPKLFPWEYNENYTAFIRRDVNKKNSLPIAAVYIDIYNENIVIGIQIFDTQIKRNFKDSLSYQDLESSIKIVDDFLNQYYDFVDPKIMVMK